MGKYIRIPFDTSSPEWPANEVQYIQSIRRAQAFQGLSVLIGVAVALVGFIIWGIS